MSVKQRKTMNSSYFSTPPVVKNLIIINCLAFLGVWLIPSLNQFMGQYGVLYWFGSPYYHSYQFVTYMFLHASLEHLFFNMFALWMFGRTLEYALGSKRFLIYYMVCGVGAALVQMGVAGLTGEFAEQMGACAIIRGVRNTTDFEYERTMEATNHRIYPEITTVMLFTPSPVADISSSTVREVLSFGRTVEEFMPEGIDINNYLQ